MHPPHGTDLRFTDRDAFGRFCVALRDDRELFALAGFQTIVLSLPTVKRLQDKSKKLLEEFLAQGLVEVSPTPSRGRRRLPSRQQAEALLKKFTRRAR